MTATQERPDTARRPDVPLHRKRPVVSAERGTPLIPVQRRAPVELADDPKKSFPAAAAIRAAALPAALLIAVIAQLVIVNRLPLPGSVPDLVLLTVAAIAVSFGPLAGTLAGFAGGLALDVAPPAAHFAGEYALVFCLVGYAAGRVRGALEDATGERDPVVTLAVMCVATVAGEAGKAAIGLLLSDPAVTGPVIARVLPAAVLYDLILSPVVLWLVSRARARPRPARAPHTRFTPAQHLTGALRQASAGAAPNLRLAGSGGVSPQQPLPRRVPRLPLAGSGGPQRQQSPPRHLPNLRLAGSRAAEHQPSPPRRLPRLRLASAGSSGIFRTNAAGSLTGPLRPVGGRSARLNFAGDHPAPVSRRLTMPGNGWLRSLGIGRGHTVRFTATSGSGLGGGVTPVPDGHRPGPAKGWLRPARPAAPAKRRSPAKGWLRPAKPPRPNWYTRGPSTAWLRRSRSRTWNGRWRSGPAVRPRPTGPTRWQSRRTPAPAALLARARSLFRKPKGGRW